MKASFSILSIHTFLGIMLAHSFLVYFYFKRTSANGTYALLAGEWSIDNSPKQLSVGSPDCDPSSYNLSIVAYNYTCNTLPTECLSALPPVLCYCTSYGHDDQCYIEYYMQEFNGAITPLASNPNSNKFRGGQTTYWQKFEFVIDFTITNYAMLSSSLPLYVKE